jgi:hypothetical protein
MKTPASAHLLPEIALPYAYNELTHLIHGSFVLRLAGVAQCADIA